MESNQSNSKFKVGDTARIISNHTTYKNIVIRLTAVIENYVNGVFLTGPEKGNHVWGYSVDIEPIELNSVTKAIYGLDTDEK